MQRYIAFLSGLPIGSGATEMPALRRLFSQLGFTNVETFLTTGNVSFETAPVGNLPPLEAQISRHLQKKLGDEVGVYIRTPEELADLVAYEPFPPEDLEAPGTSLFVILLPTPVTGRAQRQLRFSRTEADDFHVHGRQIYWLRRDSADGTSSAPPLLAEILEVPATVRGIGTLRKLVEGIRKGAETTKQTERVHRPRSSTT